MANNQKNPGVSFTKMVWEGADTVDLSTITPENAQLLLQLRAQLNNPIVLKVIQDVAHSAIDAGVNLEHVRESEKVFYEMNDHSSLNSRLMLKIINKHAKTPICAADLYVEKVYTSLTKLLEKAGIKSESDRMLVKDELLAAGLATRASYPSFNVDPLGFFPLIK